MVYSELHEVTLVVVVNHGDSISWLSLFEQQPLPGTTAAIASGSILLTFRRPGKNLSCVLITAVQQVFRLGLRIRSLAPHYLVSASEAAARLGISAAAITQHQKRGYAPPFPPPVCRMLADRALFDWVDVSVWGYKRGRLDWKQVKAAAVMREAELLIALNGKSPNRLVSELRRRLPPLESGLEQR